jgi:hypothetical protein
MVVAATRLRARSRRDLPMGSDVAVRKFAHQANIDRYRRILNTFLTLQERSFVEVRLAEERAALQQLVNGAASEPKMTEL